MKKLSLVGLVTVIALPLVTFAVGCAAPASSDEGQASEDLSAPTTSNVDRPSTSAGGGVVDPLCIEHKLHSQVCVYDWLWRADAETICEKEGKHLESFEIDLACAEPGSSAGGDPSSAAGEPSSAAGGAKDPSATNAGGVVKGQPSAQRVTFACCNGGVGPLVQPRPASAAGEPRPTAVAR